MPMILVTPLSAVEESIRRYSPSHLVTLLSPEHMIDTPEGLLAERHLRLGVNDVADAWESDCAPCAEHVGSLIAFGRGWTAEAPLLVHCWAGVSRSMAAAYVLLCDRLGPGAEHHIARTIRARAPHAWPNPLIVRLADAALGRNGAMISAVEAIGRGTIVAEGRCVELPLMLRDPAA
jgi:predicted protein tyrosine phosphatase